MDFKECLRKGIAKEVKMDLDLVESLKKTSQNKLDSENKLELNEVTSSSKISLLYDSLRELLEALAIKNKYKIYNHECYTCFLKEIMNESSKGDEFDELRKIRNSINYYAGEIPVEEAKDVLKRIKKLREEILTLVLKKKRALIIHGWDFNPKMNWYPWLKKELENKGYEVIVPTMPNTSEPKISEWVSHLKKVVGKLDDNTYFVGHSMGCQTIMRFLEKENYGGKIPKVVFVAGWFKLDNLEDKEVEAIAKPWTSIPIDLNKVKQKLSKLTVFLSSNEPYGFIEENSNIFKEKLGAKVIILKNKGHFTEDDGVNSIKEILSEL